jgi:hypothetical protein
MASPNIGPHAEGIPLSRSSCGFGDFSGREFPGSKRLKIKDYQKAGNRLQ